MRVTFVKPAFIDASYIIEVEPRKTLYNNKMMTSSHTPQLLLVDDHKMVAVGLSSLLSQRFGVTIAYNLLEMSDKLAAQRFDLALLDLHMKDGHPCKSYREMLKRSATPILMVASYMSDADLYDCHNHGVRGYISKNHSEIEFERAIDRAVSGKEVWDHDTRIRLDKFKNEKPNVPKRVIPLLKELLANPPIPDKDIARVVGLSSRTVHNYMQLLLQAYGVNHRYQLVSKLQNMGYTKDLLPDVTS